MGNFNNGTRHFLKIGFGVFFHNNTFLYINNIHNSSTINSGDTNPRRKERGYSIFFRLLE